MKKISRIFLGLALILSQTMCTHTTKNGERMISSSSEDENLWLETIESPPVLEWVRAHNQATLTELEGDPRYSKFKEQAEKIVMSQNRVPTGDLRNGYIYNFWQDDKNVRGLWRRATLAEYKKAQPKWEVLLNIDDLAAKEKENWVYHGSSCLAPRYHLCLVMLSRGGKDAEVVREFNIELKQFVTNGFELPEAKQNIAWRDENTLWVATDWGNGSLTTSGYPRIIKEWKRGTKLSEAQTLFEVSPQSINATPSVIHRPERSYEFLVDSKTFYTSEVFFTSKENNHVKVPVQDDAIFNGIMNGQMIFQLRSKWTLTRGGKQYEFAQGALVSIAFEDVYAGKKDFQVHPIFTPTATTFVDWTTDVKDSLYVGVTENVKGRLLRYQYINGQWNSQTMKLPETGSFELNSSDSFESNLLVTYESFLESSRVFHIHGNKIEKLKSQKEHFNAKGLKVTQNFATSADGTKVPYFMVAKKSLALTNKNPTLLYGYGGFEYSIKPYYWGTYGKLWLERGGILVIANIRGGGEYGPAWHQAAIGKNRQRAYDDFIAVGEDLIKRKITAPKFLGSMGGSNGGLLVGATFVQRPDLFGAVVCQVPLLDMMRYNKLLAGASWMGEYGNPDIPEERQYLLTYSPYQNVKPTVAYPKVFFLTSTKDDRVHPGHARKMVARMEALENSIYYYENIDGGHSAAANLKETARRNALEVIYLSRQLGLQE